MAVARAGGGYRRLKILLAPSANSPRIKPDAAPTSGPVIIIIRRGHSGSGMVGSILVERLLGAEVARLASRMFLIDVNKAPQRAYAIFSTQKAHADPDILRTQHLIEHQVGLGLSVDELSQKAGMSRRNFVRRFVRATGNSPREYVQRVRMEAAKRALEDGEASVAGVARAVGYQDPVAFRKVFARLTGLTPVDYRARYGPGSPPTVIRAGGGSGRGRARPAAHRG